MEATPSFWRKKGSRIAPTLFPPLDDTLDPPGDDPSRGLRCEARLTSPVGDANVYYVILRFRDRGKIAVTGPDWQNVKDASHFSVPSFTFAEGTSVEAVLFLPASPSGGSREVEHVDVARAAKWTFTGKGFEGSCVPHSRDVAQRDMKDLLTEIDGRLADRAQRTIDLRLDDFGMGFSTGARLFGTETDIDPKPHPAALIERALLRAAAWVGWADPRVADRVRRLAASDKDLLDRFGSAWDRMWVAVPSGASIADVKCEPVAASARSPWRCEITFKGFSDGAFMSLEIFARDFRWTSIGSPRGGKATFSFELPRADNRALLRVKTSSTWFVRIERLL